MIPNSDYPIIRQRYIDSDGNLELRQHVNETYSIFKNCIILNDIPDEYKRVFIDGYIEVMDTDIIGDKEFKVIYGTHKVLFNPSQEGQIITVTSYYGIGLEKLSATNVFTKLDENGNIVETMDEKLESLNNDIVDFNSKVQTIDSNEQIRQDNESVRLVNETVRQDLYTQVKTETLMIYKDSVSTYSDIATTYPNPQEGWVVQTTNDIGSPIYRYNGTQWVNMGNYFNSGDIVVSTDQPTTVNNMWIKKI